MIEEYQKRLFELLKELDAIIKDLWDPWETNDGFQALIDLNGWRDKLAEMEKDLQSRVMKEVVG